MTQGLKPTSIHFGEVISRVADTDPARPAIIYADQTTTFGELDGRINQLAHALRALGIGPGDRVGFLDKNSPAFFEAMFAAARINAVLVPFNWRLAVPELEAVMRDAGITILIASPEYIGTVNQVLPRLDRPVRLVVLEGTMGGVLSYPDLLAAQPQTPPAATVNLEDTCLQIYTSGTTGRPKGVQLTHANMLHLLQNGADAWRFFAPDIVTLVVLPTFHIGGISWSCMSFFAGAPIVLLREFNPAEVLRVTERYKATTHLFVPSMVLMILSHPALATTDLSAMRTVAYGGSPMPLELLEKARKAFGCNFSHTYALSETTGQITVFDLEDLKEAYPERINSCGKPLPNVHIRVVDPNGADVPAGTIGEIVVRSPQNTRGYWGQEEATAALVRDGWLYTGDAGMFDEHGFLYVKDRIKDMVISGGENIYPAEVENALFAHPAVAEAAVVGHPDERWGETVKAFIVRKPGVDVSAEELTTHCRSLIAGYKIPRLYEFVEMMPRSASGKILKFELRHREGPASGPAQGSETPAKAAG